jgi:hypothetical protein
MESLGADGGRRPAINKIAFGAALGFGAEIKAVSGGFWRFLSVILSVMLARLEATLARCSVPLSFMRRFGPPLAPSFLPAIPFALISELHAALQASPSSQSRQNNQQQPMEGPR